MRFVLAIFFGFAILGAVSMTAPVSAAVGQFQHP